MTDHETEESDPRALGRAERLRQGEQKTPEQEQEELRREIEQTRADLGATVEALSQKADVKTQAREKVEHAKTQVRGKVEHAKRERPVAPLAAGIGVALVGLWLLRRRRRS